MNKLDSVFERVFCSVKNDLSKTVYVNALYKNESNKVFYKSEYFGKPFFNEKDYVRYIKKETKKGIKTFSDFLLENKDDHEYLNFHYNSIMSPNEGANKISSIVRKYFDKISPNNKLDMITIPLYINTRKGKSYILVFNIIVDDYKFTDNDFVKVYFHLRDFGDLYFIDLVHQTQLKTAIISILIDSYAHNISAHSLAALKWWIELRHKILDKRFSIPKTENGIQLNCIKPCWYFIDQTKTSETTERYYEALGQTDSTYNKDYYSLFDFLQFADTETVEQLFQFSTEVKQKDRPVFNPRFPVPIDYALYPFFRFLRDKGAFWSGVTRDMTFGGESKTWYKILWEDFANNPLYLGTIAKSEGITKINIYLKVKTKDKNDKDKLVEGRFVTIDMSVIDYESAIADSPVLEAKIGDYDPENKLIKVDESNVTELTRQIDSHNEKIDKYNKENTDKKKKKVVPFLDSTKYSKYAFIKLGEQFANFRETLDNEESFRVFLPGGIVGEHALFTIFENQIRNIKHYKNSIGKIQNSGIDFWISIEEEKLVNTDPAKKQLFKVGVWLEHETKLIKKQSPSKDRPEYLLFTITDNTIKTILDETTNAPRMGGNSQDKACAAMLFNNEFSSVENKGNSGHSNERDERDKEYFPWIEFKTFNKNSQEERGIDLVWKNGQKNIREDSVKKYLKSIKKDDEGFLKKYFYLWRGEDVLDKYSIALDGWENPARARFLVNESKWNDNEIIRARKNGIIRIVDDAQKPSNIKELNQLYKKWLNENWLKDKTNFTIDFYNDTYPPTICLKFAGGDLTLDKGSYHWHTKENIILYLSHGDEKQYHCNVRSHGTFWSKFFKEIESKQPSGLEKILDMNSSPNKEYKKILLMYEIWETILTKVVIFDNRVYQRLPISYNNKNKLDFYKDEVLDKTEQISRIDMLKNQLSLEIFGEDEIEFKNFLESQQTKSDTNFLIMHLSFIEKLKDENGVKYSEDSLHQFIKDKLKCLYHGRENFIFVVTSGRGRDKWRDSMKINNKELEKFTIFKPVESLLSAVEHGISYNDHFDIKYNLLKVLFGN